MGSKFHSQLQISTQKITQIVQVEKNLKFDNIEFGSGKILAATVYSREFDEVFVNIQYCCVVQEEEID